MFFLKNLFFLKIKFNINYIMNFMKFLLKKGNKHFFFLDQ